MFLFIRIVFSQSYAPPKTINAAVDSLSRSTSYEDKALIKYTVKSKLGLYHHGLGKWIRNNYKLWGGNDSLLDECAKIRGIKQIHPDEASGIIIEAFWEYLQNETIQYSFSPSISIKCDNYSSEQLMILENNIIYSPIAWRSGISDTKSVKVMIIDGKIDKLTITGNENDLGIGYQLEESFRSNWGVLKDALNIMGDTALLFSVEFNAKGKMFEEYSQE